MSPDSRPERATAASPGPMTATRIVLATWFGSGYSPIAPGTAGTAATLPLVALLWWIGSWPLHLAVTVAVAWAGLWAARGAEERWGKKDPGRVVIDETAGTLVTAFLVHPAAPALSAYAVPLALVFFVFRAFDIVKPWPARRLERLPGALGIMIDDLFAGAYACIVVHVILRLIGSRLG